MTRGAGRMANRDSCSWLNAIHYPTPEQNLLAAVVKSAALEGQRRLRLARQRPRAGQRRTGNRLVLAPLHQPD